jgi:hypothetical protein
MPSQQINYTNTVIYKIVSKNLAHNYTYVGFTTDFVRRKAEHKRVCNQEYNTHYNDVLYKTIREIGGWDTIEMIQIEKFPCNNGMEAKARQRYWFETLNENSTIEPVEKPKSSQYNDDKKDQIKRWVETNRDKYNTYQKEKQRLYYKKNKASISV